MASDRNPNIRREQSVRFTAPASNTETEAIVAGIGGVAEAAIGFRQEQLASQLETDLMQAQEEALAAMQADMTQEGTDMGGRSLSAGEEMSLQEFAQKMSDLQSAANQGTSSITNLKIRQEKILRDYMSRYPMLTPKFQQAANGVLGYSPIGAQLRAAEAAQSAASGASMPPILNLLINQAVQAGVDATLYVRNPVEFWAQAQHKLSLRQQVTTTDQTLAAMKGQADLTQLTNQPAWARFTADMGELMWGEEILPSINAFYEDLEIAPGMSPQQRQMKIEQAMNDGRYRAMELGLIQEREQWIVDMYERYQGSEGGTSMVNGVRIPAMTLEQFREKTAPLLEQYNWAIANLGDAKSMEMMEMFNKARSARVISGMPDNLMTLAEMGKLFGADNTFSQILTQGVLGDTASVIVSEFINRQFGGAGGAGEGGPTTQTIVPSTTGGDAKPGRGDPQSRMMTIEEVSRVTGNSVEDADEALRNINRRLGHEWVDAYGKTNDRVYALGAWTLAKEYGNMVANASVNGGILPSEDTDNVMLELLSNPEFAAVTRAATEGMPGQMKEAAMQGMVSAMRARAGGVVDEALGRVVLGLEQDSVAEPDTGSRYGRPGAPTVTQLGSKVANYVEYDLDPANYTIEFKLRDDVPSYQRANVQRIVDRMNEMPLESEQTLVRLTMASAHALGVEDPRAYRYLLDQTFGIGGR